MTSPPGPVDVLVVDDHRDVRAALARMVVDTEGLRLVGVAVDGADAVELVRRLQPHVVLMDVTMPELDGVEATRRIVAAHPGVSVVLLSADDDTSRVRDALAAGAAAYLLKHERPREIVAAVRSVALGGPTVDLRADGVDGDAAPPTASRASGTPDRAPRRRTP